MPPDEEDINLTDTSVAPVEDEFVDDLADEVIDEPTEDVVVDPIEARIREIEAILEDQDALIEIPDNELAALRAELAALQGADAPLDDALDAQVDEAGDPVATDVVDDVAEDPVTTAPAVVTRPAPRESLLDTILGYLTNFWVIIGAALVAAVGVLAWFMRRAGSSDDDSSGMWQALDEDSLGGDAEDLSSTASLTALGQHDDTTILVEENVQPASGGMMDDDLSASASMEMPPAEEFSPALDESDDDELVADFDIPAEEPAADPLAATGSNESLEDTFSSETAINLDQSDPVAEADFHMAYGLYDQAADVINGALATEPERRDLLSKLCEIYFVWGNRDAFVDSAGRLQALGGGRCGPRGGTRLSSWASRSPATTKCFPGSRRGCCDQGC